MNQADNNGITPLLVACFNGHTEVAATLVDANADINQAINLGLTR